DDWCRIARIYDQYALFGNAIVPACVEWVCQRIGKSNIEFTKSSWQRFYSRNNNRNRKFISVKI
ncbi:MAG: hypothetical protein ACKPGB_30520, partial [Dolichospermum sp.]